MSLTEKKTKRVRKSICIIWQGTYPWDVRIEKFIGVLKGEGGVHIICRGKTGIPKYEKTQDYSVKRIMSGKIFSVPFPFNPFWLYICMRYVYRNKISLLIARDLPVTWLALILGKIYGIPVLFDMAENYPAALKAYNKRRYNLFLKGNAFLPRLYERIAVMLSSHVAVVTQEQKIRLIKAGCQPDKISLVMNTPVLEEIGALDTTNSADDNKTILYTGKVDAHRGVDTAIKAFSLVLKKYPSANIVIAGSGRHMDAIKEFINKLGIQDNVKLTGWVPHSDIYQCIRQSAVCIIPHTRSEHTDTTLPNKLFDYMALAKPVIASDMAPVARILKTHHCGFTFKSGDAKDLARRIEHVLSLPSHELGANGRAAVEKTFNWQTDAKILQNVIHSILT